MRKARLPGPGPGAPAAGMPAAAAMPIMALAAGALAAILVTITPAAARGADPAFCRRDVTAVVSVPGRSRDAARRATARAIAAWRAEVRRVCPSYSNSWRQATLHKMTCRIDGRQQTCRAHARPARRR